MEIPTFKSRRFEVPSVHGKEFILKEEILYCEADGNYTRFFMLRKEENFLATLPLHECEMHLPPADGFLRVHNSYIINTNHIVKYIKGKDGIFVLVNKARVPLSEKYKKNVLDTLGADWKKNDENNGDWMDKEMD